MAKDKGWIELELAPGFYTERTDRGAKLRWKSGNRVRFQNGLPEKLGGWTSIKNTSGNHLSLNGKCRAIHDWSSLDGQKWAAFGTEKKLYLLNGGTLYDITPLRLSGNLTDPFTTTNGSPLVTVTHVANGVAVGDYVHFSGAMAVGGITVTGEYTVTSIVDPDNYRITHGSNATSSAGPGGGTVAYEYEVTVGNSYSASSSGYGAGGYGLDTAYGGMGWGTARTSVATIVEARAWSLDNFGEDLVASYQGGRIYVWDRSTSANTRATLISASPTTTRRMLVSTEDRHVIAFGAHDGTADDPMLVRWSDQENYNSFTATISNSAGDKRLDYGSRIIAAVKSRNDIVIVTDEALYAMRFVGGADVYSFTMLGAAAASVGPTAAIDVNGLVMYMGRRDFYVYDGVIRAMPCDVRSYVYEDINTSQIGQAYASVNRLKSEVWWFYPSQAAQDNDRYVVYNYNEKVWYYGELERTAFTDTSSMFGVPYGVDPDGNLYQHEVGHNADTDAMDDFLESYDFALGNGRALLQIDELVPDFKELDGSVDVTFKARKYPHADQSTNGPFTVTSDVEVFNPRVKGRQVALRIESADVDDHWAMGTWRYRASAHGLR